MINHFWINKYYTSYTNFLQSYDYSILPFIHYYLLFIAFSDKIYAPVSFKIVSKSLLIKNFVKRKYGLKMCTVKMLYTKHIDKYIQTWICQYNIFHLKFSRFCFLLLPSFFKLSLSSLSKLSSTTFFPFFSCYLNWFFFIIIKVISLFFIFLLKSSFFKCSFSLRFWLYRCSFYIYIYIYSFFHHWG